MDGAGRTFVMRDWIAYELRAAMAPVLASVRLVCVCVGGGEKSAAAKEGHWHG